MVKRLLDAGANLQCAARSIIPLHDSAEKIYTLTVDYLLEVGADVNALRSKGDAALYFASTYGNLYVIRNLGKGAQARLAAPSIISPLDASRPPRYC